MIDPDNPKEYRRQQMQKNYEKKPSPSDETKFLAILDLDEFLY